MQVGTQIRAARGRRGLSQDELAARIYVSRQTVSSWETGKTCPDLQSLLLLSEIFGVSVDELVKGDVTEMAQRVERDGRLLGRLGAAMAGLLALMLAAVLWGFWQVSHEWGWHAAPTFVLAAVLWAGAMGASVWCDRIKREHDVLTYQEICDFMAGRPVDRATERSRRARSLTTVGSVVLAAALVVGGFAGGYVLAWLASLLLG